MNSPVWHEPTQLMSGVAVWRYGRFNWFRVNPPLVRAFAALPVVLQRSRLDFPHLDRSPAREREEFAASEIFVRQMGPAIIRAVEEGRVLCLSFIVVGAIACWRWARMTYGVMSGLMALILWCFSPLILAHGTTIMNDVPCASMCALYSYRFAVWVERPELREALVAGVALGLALACKFTALLLLPLGAALFSTMVISSAATMRTAAGKSSQLALSLLIAIYVLNLSYAFRGCCEDLDQFRFKSLGLTGYDSLNKVPIHGANRFKDSWLGGLPVPLPADMVIGIDTQLLDFERGLPSYLAGEWAPRGWWYYYAAVLAVKTPAGILLLCLLALGLTFFARDYSPGWRRELLVVAPGVALLALVSAKSGISAHGRYAIPALPYLFVWASRAAISVKLRRRGCATVAAMALAWGTWSSLSCVPHSLAYFNELTGGPLGGPHILLDSNVDWGQGLRALKEYLQRHPDVKLDGLAYHGSIPPTFAGIPETPLPPANGLDPRYRRTGERLGPLPGVYAVSVNHVFENSTKYSYFKTFKVQDNCGFSIYIYYLTSKDVERYLTGMSLSD